MDRLVAILALAVLMTGACKRSDGARAGDSAQTRRLVGAWRGDDGQREYVLNADGTFSMMVSVAACVDAREQAPTTASGTWSVNAKHLVLSATDSSEAYLRGATMTDLITALDGSTLVLDSSVAGCSGKTIRLSRR
jgi:hypothetical protein